MSTVSSQLIVTSSALTEDLYKLILRKNASDKELVFFGRMAVLTISVIACLLALGGENKTILGLVAYAWAGFGASFGPVILLSLYWRKMTNWGAIVGMLAGATTVIIWKNIDLQITRDVYEIIPGFIVNLIVIIAISLFTYQRDEAIEKEFDTSLKRLHTNVEEA